MIQAEYCTLEHTFLGEVEKLCMRSAHFFWDVLHPQLGAPRSIPDSNTNYNNCIITQFK